MPLLIRISAKLYADTARQRRAGNLTVNPLALALIEQGIDILSDAPAEQITLMDIASGRRYSGPMPAVLTYYLAGFQRGVQVFEDHEFELLLVSKDD